MFSNETQVFQSMRRRILQNGRPSMGLSPENDGEGARASLDFVRPFRGWARLVLMIMVLAGVGTAQQPTRAVTPDSAASNSAATPLQLGGDATRPANSLDGHAALSGDADPLSAIAGKSSDLAYWLDQQGKIQADGTRLQARLSDLGRRIAASRQKELGDKVRACDSFIADIARVQSEAVGFVDPEWVRPFELAQHIATERCEALKGDLAARIHEEGAELSSVARQAEEAKQEIGVNAELLRAVSNAIENLRNAQLRQNKVEELKAVLPGGSGSVPSDALKLDSSTTGKP